MKTFLIFWKVKERWEVSFLLGLCFDFLDQSKMETFLIFWEVKGAGKSAPSLGSVLICRREQDLIERLTSCRSVLIFKGESKMKVFFSKMKGFVLPGFSFDF